MTDGVTTEYTPSMDAVRRDYANHFEVVQETLVHRFADIEEGFAEFDRALAAHDREVAEKAWDEGYQKGLGTQYGTATPTGKPYDPDPNPYRLEQSND